MVEIRSMNLFAGRHPVGLRCLWLLLLVVLPSAAHAQWHKYTDTAMTTPVELEFWFDDQKAADAIAKDVLAVFHQVDRNMSRYREDSELSGLNRRAAESPVKVSPDLFQVLKKAGDVAELSGGAFDISFGSVGFLYDYREHQQPSAEDIRSRLGRINYQDIVLNEAEHTVFYRQQGLLLDLGGIAKGFAVDLGIERLMRAGVRHARLSAGGDLRLLGDKRGSPWLVGVRDPRSGERNAVVLPLADVAISTSGDYERFFINKEGERVHHILAPGTGKSVRGVQSVTIIGNDALTTDGLSTAVFVLGPEKGLEMIERLPGIDAIIIDDKRIMHFSEGLAPPES